MQRPSTHRAFSFIELMISVALISIFYALYFGSGSKSYQAKAQVKCLHQLEQMHLALQLYAREHEGAFPHVPHAATSDEPLSLLVPQYTADTSLFICPAGKLSALPAAAPLAGRRLSYAYHQGVKQGPADATTPLVADSHRHGAGNVLFADGHVENTVPSVDVKFLPPLP